MEHQSPWDVGYDCGYYDALNNAISSIAINIGTYSQSSIDIGTYSHDIIKILVEMRNAAYVKHEKNI